MFDSRHPPHTLGLSRGYHWRVDAEHVDMAVPLPEPRPLTIASKPQRVTLDLSRSALVVIDMQNDFCAKDGGSITSGSITRPTARRSSRCVV
jgi:hypothetical protein